MPDRSMSPWQHGAFRGKTARLLFGNGYEDPQVELGAFPARSRVFCIAGAGFTAKALASAGHRVTAVDVNPVQLQYAAQRAQGAPMRMGLAEWLLVTLRAGAGIVGWSRSDIDEFLSMSIPAEQLRFWQRHFETRRWIAAIDFLLSSPVLRCFYSRHFLDAVPSNFGALIRARLRRCWSTHPNRWNPFAALMLLGRAPNSVNPPMPVDFVCADAATYLESCPPSTFQAFSLSNILDGAPEAYARRLHAAIARAAAPGAVVVNRTFREPFATQTANHAALDRTGLWGGLTISEAGDPCFMF